MGKEKNVGAVFGCLLILLLHPLWLAFANVEGEDSVSLSISVHPVRVIFTE